MRVAPLMNRGEIYSSNVYLVLGDWSRLGDVNTLVDVGSDPSVLESLEQAPTGVGKSKVEQVVLTHGHSDHCALLPRIREAFQPRVLAFSPSIEGVDDLLRDGQVIRMGDRDFEVIHTPGHSSDSVCLYNRTQGVLFAGDAPVVTASPGGAYEPPFLAALEKLCRRDVRLIYFGHGAPLGERCNERLHETLRIAAGRSPAPAGREQIRNQAPLTAP
jgi:glyoxylase-like metal-dependent hydrolase (beta-lactamase superfamily II)